jgi:predicted nuclease of predicted toxin-antitoxin system
MRLLLDEHLSAPRLGEALGREGHDVRAAARDPVLAGAADEALLRAARAEGRILLTRNVRDFAPLLVEWAGSGERHSGCVLIEGIDHAQVGLLLRGLRLLLDRHPAQEEWVDLVLWLGPGAGAG